MSWMGRSTLLAVPVIAASIGVAATRGEHGDRSDAANVAAVAPPRRVEKKNSIQLDQNLVTALYRVGLQPDHLAAAGVTAELADDVVVGVKTWLGQNAPALASLDERVFAAISNRDRLIRLVRSGQAKEQEIVDCQAAIAEATAADAARALSLTSAFDAGTAAVSADKKQLLARIQTNELAWSTPQHYLVTDRTQEEWVRLRDAVINERVALSRNEAPDPDEAVLLAAVRADVAVAAAKTSLDTTFGAVKAAWETAAAIQ